MVRGQGEGLAQGTTLGPLANPRRRAAMQQMTEDAIAQGAKVLTGGARHDHRCPPALPCACDAAVASAAGNASKVPRQRR